jgi:hypothetical protein
VEKVYLYQGDTYIGEAFNSKQVEYNEFAYERTEEDKAKMLEQHKRGAKWDKMMKENKGWKIGMMEAPDPADWKDLLHKEMAKDWGRGEVVEVVETVEAEEDEYGEIDYSLVGMEMI